jgi:2-oxoglutarate ferredoxin oxidoreductase subunit beta
MVSAASQANATQAAQVAAVPEKNAARIPGSGTAAVPSSIAPKVATPPFASDLKPVWCPGCGSYGLLGTFRKALASLGVTPENVMITSGIGCSSRLPAYVTAYGFHTVHGRAIPCAVGAYLANPSLTHVVFGGDGDIFSIGGGHLPHVARRNPKITVFVLDNEIYGLTKGQASPTTPPSVKSKSMPDRLQEQPLNPAMMCLAYDVSFFARAYAGNLAQLSDIMTQALCHPGLAVVQVLNPCVTYNNQWETWNKMVQPISDSHDTSNRLAAMALAADEQRLHTGVFYKAVRPTLQDLVQARRDEAVRRGYTDLMALIRQYA